MLQIGGIRQRHKRATPSFILIFLLWAAVVYVLFNLPDTNRRYRKSLEVEQLNQRIIASRNHVQIVESDNGVTWPYRVFKSDRAKPPRVDVVDQGTGLSGGYLFVTAQLFKGPGKLDRAPYIFSTDGELVFAATLMENISTGNFLVQEYLGKPRLTTWRGNFSQGRQVGHAYGVVVLIDENYEEVTVDVKDESINANMGDGVLPGHIDVHEQRLTEWGSVLVSVYNATTTNASHIGGSEHQAIFDCIIYDIDVATQKILWTWSTLDHVSVEDSFCPLNRDVHGEVANDVPWDALHLNSIEAVGRDHVLVSVRSTWSVYLINRHDGSIAWTLHGEHGGDFGRPSEDASFRWQHDARLLEHTPDKMVISIYDNHRNDSPPTANLTRGLVLDLALPPDSATPPKLIHSTPAGVDSAKYQGNYQAQLFNGNEFMSYGDKTLAVELGQGPDGKSEERWRARYGRDGVVASYRAFKFPWSGTPKGWDPSLVVEVGGGQATAYVSWNGAIDIAYWQLYSSVSDGSTLEKTGIVKKQGFETMFEVELSRGSCLRVGAVLSTGAERLSNLVCL